MVNDIVIVVHCLTNFTVVINDFYSFWRYYGFKRTRT